MKIDSTRYSERAVASCGCLVTLIKALAVSHKFWYLERSLSSLPRLFFFPDLLHSTTVSLTFPLYPPSIRFSTGSTARNNCNSQLNSIHSAADTTLELERELVRDGEVGNSKSVSPPSRLVSSPVTLYRALTPTHAVSRIGKADELPGGGRVGRKPGKAVLVPLAGSLYAPGTLADIEHVLVDIGMGYYVEKDVPSAGKFCAAKVEYPGENLAEFEEIIAQKSQNARVVGNGMLSFSFRRRDATESC